MKTKFQILAAVVLFAAMSNAASAKESSRVSAILGNEAPIGSVNATTSGNLILPVNGLAADAGNNLAEENVADNIDNTVGYHHHGGGGGSDGFSGNIINVGIGFVSGEGNLYTGGGYTSSVGPAFEASYEHALNSKFGVGLNIAYQSAKSTYTYQDLDPTTFVLTNYVDTYKLSLLQFCARFAYHFSAGDKFDPYVGACIGYCTISDSYTSTYPGETASKTSLTGVEFGGYGGARYFFSDHVGAWAEIQYAVASFKVATGISGVSASVGINPCTVFNLGICFKF